MKLALPLQPGVPAYTFFAVLDGVTYGFDVLWNDRSATFFMDITDVQGNEIVAGAKVVLGTTLFGRSPAVAMPPGQFILVDTSGADLDAGLNDLGNRVQVVYYSASEFA